MRTLAFAVLLAPLALAQAQTPERLHTDRDGKALLRLPKEDDAFGFVVFGDRTGGPPEGIAVLRQAVRDTNLLDPDLVLTVGDLINGYNGQAKWHEQADEYKTAMAALRMPWFPVAGNHDIYWRGEGRPPGEHEHNFETTFGPLWYAFEHKRCWFVVLYSDEGDAVTGKKEFTDPACQKFSDAQFQWLTATLQRAKAARHVFVFLHHPRWQTDRYPGSDWDRVHALLAQQGNVRAVFAGHIHRMRYDGQQDGIEYFTVASVGAFLDMEAPQAGYLHEFHVVTVRPEGIQVGALPVGQVLDPKQITKEVSADTDLLHQRLLAENLRGLEFGNDGQVDGLLRMEFANPASRPIELTVLPGGDGSWAFSPDHTHAVVAAGERSVVTFAVRRTATPGLPTLPHLEIGTEYLGPGLRIALPKKRCDVLVPPPAHIDAPLATHDGALRLSGSHADSLHVDSERLQLPDGDLTLEAWIEPSNFAGRRAIATKTESSEFGLFGSDGRLAFLVHTGAGYATAETTEPVLHKGQWQHVAGVADGSEVRVYHDGKLVGRAERTAGARKRNALPFYVGADPDARGQPMALFAGRIDEVRVSKTARYRGESFTPARRCEPDADTVLLLHLDQDTGAWTPDASPLRAHATRRGDATCVVR